MACPAKYDSAPLPSLPILIMPLNSDFEVSLSTDFTRTLPLEYWPWCMRFDITSKDLLLTPKMISTSSAHVPASFIMLSVLQRDRSDPNMAMYHHIFSS